MHPYINTAIKAARSAGKIAAQAIDRMDRIKIERKTESIGDYVTDVDKACEQEITKIILEAYPSHGLLGEEGANKESEDIKKTRWIIDPIDGTFNFIHGVPLFAISIGVEVNGSLEHGLVFNPISGELFTASRGEGAMLDSRRIRVSGCASMEDALVSTRFHNPAHDLRRLGAASLDLAFVAAGRFDGYIEKNLKPWDIAAGVLIVKEAGGFVGDFDGKDGYMQSGNIVAGTPKIYPQLLESSHHTRNG